MILSKEDLFCEDQAITDTAASTNVLDLGAEDGTTPNPNLRGDRANIFCQVTEDFATLTSLTATVQTDDNSSFGSAKALQSMNIAVAELLEGKRFLLGRVEGVERYVRIYFGVTGTTATTGKVTAGITFDQQVNGG